MKKLSIVGIVWISFALGSFLVEALSPVQLQQQQRDRKSSNRIQQKVITQQLNMESHMTLQQAEEQLNQERLEQQQNAAPTFATFTQVEQHIQQILQPQEWE